MYHVFTHSYQNVGVGWGVHCYKLKECSLNWQLLALTHQFTTRMDMPMHAMEKQSVSLLIKSYPVVLVYTLAQLFIPQKQIIACHVRLNQSHLRLMPVSAAVIALLCL